MLVVELQHTFSAEDVEDFLVTMFEGNDMVNSWCEGIRIERNTESVDKSYSAKEWYKCFEDGCTIYVKAEDHSYKGKGVRYKEYPLDLDILAKSFAHMQKSGYNHVAQHLLDDYDALDVDVWLQFAIFGEEVYS